VFDSGIQNHSRISHWVRRAVVYLEGYNFQKTWKTEDREGVVAQQRTTCTDFIVQMV